MKNQNRILGKWGEKEAESFLQERGYKILDRNFRTPYGEIDIICSKQDLLVFVEVKTRKSSSFGNPEVSISQRKLEHMENSANFYIQEIDHAGTWQIDVISIFRKELKHTEIVHFENVVS